MAARSLAGYVAAVLADSPAGFWPLNEASGTVATDRSGNGKNGTYTGTCTLGSAIGRLPAVGLGGGYVNIPDDNAWSSEAGANGLMTIEAWVRFNSLAAQMFIVSKGDVSNYEYDLRLGDSVSTALAGLTYTSSGLALFNTPQNSGQVATATNYHLVMTFDDAADLLILYVNGSELVRVSTSNSPSQHSSNGTAALQIGRRADGAGGTLDGRIGCVAFYTTALSPSRILAHYQAGT